jgi:hypothetical protein
MPKTKRVGFELSESRNRVKDCEARACDIVVVVKGIGSLFRASGSIKHRSVCPWVCVEQNGTTPKDYPPVSGQRQHDSWIRKDGARNHPRSPFVDRCAQRDRQSTFALPF